MGVRKNGRAGGDTFLRCATRSLTLFCQTPAQTASHARQTFLRSSSRSKGFERVTNFRSPRLKPRANGRSIVGCYILRPFAHSFACCCVFLAVAQSLKPVKHFSHGQQWELLRSFARSLRTAAWEVRPVRARRVVSR